MFLQVEEQNLVARALYQRAGLDCLALRLLAAELSYVLQPRQAKIAAGTLTFKRFMADVQLQST